MLNVQDYINSGILELYVLGIASSDEITEVNKMCALYPEVKQEIEDIILVLKTTELMSCDITPSVTLKPFLLSIIDYTERLKMGEEITFPPILNKNSKISDYEPWLKREDINLPEDFEDFFSKIIGYNPQATTAIAWIKRGAPPEVHTSEHERFLVIEGECSIMIEESITHYKVGDLIEIPLYVSHQLFVTSAIPCKVILQRAAA